MVVFRRAGIAVAVAITALFAAVPVSAIESYAGDDGGHGGDHAAPIYDVPPDEERCDLGFNTQKFNDFIRMGRPNDIGRWNFPEMMMQPVTETELFWLGLGARLRNSVITMASDQMWAGAQVHGHVDHPLHTPWRPMTDPVECDTLKQFLQQTREGIAAYPTLGDAVDNGMTFVTPFFAGGGAHIGDWSKLDDTIEWGKPDVLVYDANDREAHLVGAMYTMISEEQPSGIVPNDEWHNHGALCWTEEQFMTGLIGLYPVERITMGGEAATKAWCDLWGGEPDPETKNIWMMHVYVVPGCGSDTGIFAHDHLYLTNRNALFHGQDPAHQGCGTGLPVDNPQIVTMETNELDIPGRLSTYRSSVLDISGGMTFGGPGAIVVDEHPGGAHEEGVEHLLGTFSPEAGFWGPSEDWVVSILMDTNNGNALSGHLEMPGGSKIQLHDIMYMTDGMLPVVHATGHHDWGVMGNVKLTFADPGLKSWFNGEHGDDHGGDHGGDTGGDDGHVHG